MLLNIRHTLQSHQPIIQARATSWKTASSFQCLSAMVMSAMVMMVGSHRAAAAIVVDFEDLPLAANSYFDGYGFGAPNNGSWSSQGTTFQTNQFGPGWSYSNVNDPTTAGFTNQWSAFTGTGFGGRGNYGLVTAGPIPPFPPGASSTAYINLPAGVFPQSVRVTNTTYAALSMRDGDSFSEKFGGAGGNDPDFLRILFTGYSASNASGSVTGSLSFDLADFRFANNSLDYIVDRWELVDLTSLGNAVSIGISFEGSRTDPIFGLNTPAYAAIDDLTLSAVPEPSSIACLGLVMLCQPFSRRRRRLSSLAFPSTR